MFNSFLEFRKSWFCPFGGQFFLSCLIFLYPPSSPSCLDPSSPWPFVTPKSLSRGGFTLHQRRNNKTLLICNLETYILRHNEHTVEMWILGIAWSSVTVVSIQPPLLPMWPIRAHPHVSTFPQRCSCPCPVASLPICYWILSHVPQLCPLQARVVSEGVLFVSFCGCLPLAQQEVFASELMVVCVSSPILFTTQDFKKSDKLVWWTIYFSRIFFHPTA